MTAFPKADVLLAGVGVVLFLIPGPSPLSQQQADGAFEPSVSDPVYEPGSGPLVLIDEGHNNFHTKNGRYQPFSRVLEADGYRVDRQINEFTEESLSAVGVLVISNALHEQNTRRWVLPTPSAFTSQEIQVIVNFVEIGGGLLLIADHMPFPGAAAELASQFDITFTNGFVFTLNRSGQSINPTVFRRPEWQGSGRSQGRIDDHPITRGRYDSEVINQIATFTGSAFHVNESTAALLVFRGDAVMYSPRVAWEFDQFTRTTNVSGWSQGAAIERGRGRVVLFGEAAMLTSQQMQDGTTAGFRSPEARDNEQLALNVVHWLSFVF